MRRITLVLACMAAFTFAGASTAMAGHNHHGYGHRAGHHGHQGHGWSGNGYHGGHGSGYRGYGGWYGAPAGYGYGVYPYAYPQPGFGVATRNFSLWFGQ